MIFAHVVNRADVGMAQRGRSTRFLEESLAAVRVILIGGRQKLDRDSWIDYGDFLRRTIPISIEQLLMLIRWSYCIVSLIFVVIHMKLMLLHLF